MRSERATFAIRIAFSAAAALLILAGASLNASGRGGAELAVAAIAGFMAVVAGAAYPEWTVAGPMAAGSLLVALLSVRFDFTNPGLPIQLAALVLLALGGFVGVTAYRSFTEALRSKLEEMDGLNSQLEDKQRAFIAATSDVDGAPFLPTPPPSPHSSPTTWRPRSRAATSSEPTARTSCPSRPASDWAGCTLSRCPEAATRPVR